MQRNANVLQIRIDIAAVLVLATTVSIVAGQEILAPAVSALRVRNQIEVVGEIITLGDVLNFADADERLRREIEHKPLFRKDPGGDRLDVSHEQIAARLGELGVNRAKITLRGARVCRITRHSRKPADANRHAPELAKDESATIESGQAVSGDRNGTLESALRAWIEEDLRPLGGRCEISFERAGAEFLELTSPEYEFVIRGSAGDAKLGLRELTVTLRQNGRVQRTIRIVANVQLIRPVLVAARPLATGVYIRRDDMRLEERLFRRDADIGLDRAEAVVGQQVKTFIEAGTMLSARQLQSVELVRRSAPVSVVGDGGAVQLRLTGIARDNGRLGDKVRVRVGESRSDQREIVGVVVGPGTVRITDQGIACAGGVK